MKTLLLVVLLLASASAEARPPADVVCSYAPSQSNLVAGTSGAAGTAVVTPFAIAQATGMTVVAHSSGAYILTGSSGYVAGTLGGAVAGPVIVGVGLLLAGVAITVELVCAPKNHPEEVAKIYKAADEFGRRYQEALKDAKATLGRAQATAAPVVQRASIEVKQVSDEVFTYAYQVSQNAKRMLPK